MMMTMVMTTWLVMARRGVYLIAFSSYYAQIPGVWGHQGILPVDAHLQRLNDQAKVPPSSSSSRLSLVVVVCC